MLRPFTLCGVFCHVTVSVLFGLVSFVSAQSNIVCSSVVKIVGTAQGGTIAIGVVGSENQDQPVTVTTLAGETAAQVAIKYKNAYNQENGDGSVKVDPDGVSLRFFGMKSGSLFYRTTDPGLPAISNVQNLTATTDRVSLRVVLSWTLPTTTLEKIYLYKNNRKIRNLPGNATGYTDIEFTPEEDIVDDQQEVYMIVTGTELNSGQNYPTRFSDILVIQAANPNTPPS